MIDQRNDRAPRPGKEARSNLARLLSVALGYLALLRVEKEMVDVSTLPFPFASTHAREAW